MRRSLDWLDRVAASDFRHACRTDFRIIINPKVDLAKHRHELFFVDLRLARRFAKEAVGLSIQQVAKEQRKLLITIINFRSRRSAIHELGFLQSALADDLDFFMSEENRNRDLIVRLLEEDAFLDRIVADGDTQLFYLTIVIERKGVKRLGWVGN